MSARVSRASGHRSVSFMASKSHVGFGWGIHLCIGAPLARAEARVAIETLLARTTSVALDAGAEPPEYVPSLMVRRLRNLPLVLHTP